MKLSNGMIAGASAVAIAAVLVVTGFAFVTWGGEENTGVIDPPAEFYFNITGEVETLQGDPVEGLGVGGASYFSYRLASQGEYLCFALNSISIYEEETGTVIDSVDNTTSMIADMRTLEVLNGDHIGTKAIDVVREDGAVISKTCEVYEVVREDTGDVFVVYVSVKDKAVYSMDFQVKRFLSEEAGLDAAVSISGSGAIIPSICHRVIVPEYVDDPSVGTTKTFNMAGDGTLTTPEGTLEVECNGVINQTVLSVESSDEYIVPMTYYLLSVRGVSSDGAETFDSDCLLGINAVGVPEGGNLYQRHVDVNGRLCTLWTLEYSNYDMVNVDKLTAYDWALFITVAVAEDGTGDVVSYSTDDRTVSYTLDETGEYTQVLDKICSLNTVF